MVTTAEYEEATALVRQLLATADIGPLHGTSSVRFEPLSGGRSAARLYKLTPLIGGEPRTAARPVVLKVAPLDEGSREKANFDTFVRPVLPPAWRPDLLGYTRTSRSVALCYSFVSNEDGTRARTLTDHLREGDTAKLSSFLAKSLELLHDKWHSRRLIRSEADLAQRYLSRYFRQAQSSATAEAALRRCAARYFNGRERQGQWQISNAEFPSPHVTLFAAARRYPYRSCILHGDLNSDNIIIARGRTHPVLVDFQRTGRGHLYEDFIALEASVRINHPSDASFDDIFEQERLIALGARDRRDTAYAAAVLQVRDTASDRFGAIEDDMTYHFAVAAVGLRLMHARDLSDIARARITASIFWATRAMLIDAPMR